MIIIQQVFIKRIKEILHKRHNKVHNLNIKIESLMEEASELSSKNKQIELEIYEKIRQENAKVAEEMKHELNRNKEEVKAGFISEKLKLEQELRKTKHELLQEIEVKLPILTKKAMKKIKQ